MSRENSLFAHPALTHWFAGRRACVIGLGKSGAAAANLLKRLGARVSVTDKRPGRELAGWRRQLAPGVFLETGGHRLLARDWDIVVASPGVPAPVHENLRRRGVPVWGELELGFRVLALAGRTPRVVAVTGTNGKTTTTALLGAIFKADGRDTVVAGNIGTPLCAVLSKIFSDTVLVLEVSSYQLETVSSFRPHVGAVLNITPDHLGRHKTMAGYAAAKFRLFQNTDGARAAVLNAADAWCRRGAKTVAGPVVWFGNGRAVSVRGRALVSTVPGAAGRWPLPRYLIGRHNLENACAALACARLLGASAKAVGKALATFRGVEHRLEEVRRWNGVRFINDSKATNVDSTFVALEAVPGPLRVILGGEDKGAPYTPLRNLLRKKAREILLIGEAAPKIRRDLNGAAPVTACGTLARAVARAADRAKSGEAVLLSPACASFDQFDNFEHRGRVFKGLVNAL